MRYVDVCAGIGAASVACRSLGWESVWFSEIASYQCKVLKHHYPEVPNLGDMTKLDNNPIYEQSDFDVLFGGTPCQDFSIAGKRSGLDGARGSLSLSFVNILERKRPRWFVWENVPGVLSSNRGKDFAAILSAFTGKTIKTEGLGNAGIIQGEFYSIAWRILDSQYFGVPQRRRRVFVVGYFGNDWRPSAGVLFERESMCRNLTPIKEEGQEIAGTIDTSLKRSRGAGINPSNIICCDLSQDPRTISFKEQLAPTITKGGSKPSHTAHVIYSSRICGTLDVSYGRFQGTSQQDMGHGHSNLIVMAHGQGGAEVVRQGEPCLTTNHEAPIVFQPQASCTQTMCYDKQSPALDKSKVPGCFFPQESVVRRLTPLECERLQGFPDNYTKVPSNSWRKARGHETIEYLDTHGYQYKITNTGKIRVNDVDGPRYESIGNSQTTYVMKWIANRIGTVDGIINRLKTEVRNGTV